MLFNIIIIVSAILFLALAVYVSLKIYKRLTTELIPYAESGTATLLSSRYPDRTKFRRFFKHSKGIIDLKKFPSLRRYHVIGGKDILVETWDRLSNLDVTTEETKILVYDLVPNPNNPSVPYVPVLCLRTVYTLRDDPTDNLLEGYRKYTVNVTWEDSGVKKIKSISSKYVLGIVKYESI